MDICKSPLNANAYGLKLFNFPCLPAIMFAMMFAQHLLLDV